MRQEEDSQAHPLKLEIHPPGGILWKVGPASISGDKLDAHQRTPSWEIPFFKPKKKWGH